ncbi:hypothetical protein [Heyndrickxia camelliae]|uniref:Uncharacterized protein n=1 Tax=Heyndrickxia camelliae TaxID=1707093 RepID=A0A2N3LG05_9BACI|nr:hypothetical protein [Heyndrickxia camelliae]PKR83548.1 hypothetical protein CWO92_18455 [Heyndrickxia camelliae]
MKVAAINAIYDVQIAQEDGVLPYDTFDIPYKCGDIILTHDNGFKRAIKKELYDAMYVPVKVIKPKPKIDYESMASGYEQMGELMKDQNEFGNNNYTDELHKIEN